MAAIFPPLCWRSAMKTLRRHGLIGVACALAAGVAVAACQPVPRPFVDTSHVDLNPLSQPENAGIVVAAVADAPPATATALAAALAETLREAGIPATVGAGNASATVLNGLVVDPGAGARIEWTLAARGEAAPVVFNQSIEGTPIRPWALADPELMAQLASEAAPRIVAMIRGEPVAPPPSTRIAVQPVTGAPGDGDASLTAAMRSALIDAGLELVAEDAADLVVVGTVEAAPPSEGQQDIRISWIVSSASGGAVGRITQESPVEANSLDEHWGDVAVFIVQGAAVGIVEILESIDASALAKVVPAAGPAAPEPMPTPPAPAQPASAAAPNIAAAPALAPPAPVVEDAQRAVAVEPPRVSMNGGWRVQLASFREREQAQRALELMAQQHTGLLGGYTLNIEEAELEAGRYYRVRTTPIVNQSAAISLCRELQAAGQDCYVIRL